jgi:hypothetical protein
MQIVQYIFFSHKLYAKGGHLVPNHFLLNISMT